jgi:NAD(P)-dependent dehydrogenase (short-subunit alcohol dehydrogenase family)
MKLAGKVCVVTGAAQGIGQAIVEEYAREGGRPAILDLNGAAAEAYAEELRSRGVDARGYACDVAEKSSVEEAAERVAEELGPCDVLVNNAGIAGNGPAIETSADEFDRIVATNLRGAWLMSVAAARRWRDAERPGVIVNIASILGLRVVGGTAPYVISKAGLVQMTEVLALEWARFGIRVNALAPGYIATSINADFFASEPGQQMIRRIPMRRLGRPEDLDGAFLLLASDASAWMTGSTVTVDGGHLVSSL